MSLRTSFFAGLFLMMAGWISGHPLKVHSTNRVAVERDVSYTSSLNGTNLGLVVVGQSKVSGQIYITNGHTGSVNVSSILISGPNAGDFAVTSFYPTTLAVGSATSFKLTGTPSAALVRSATVSINTNLPGADEVFSFPISCEGVIDARTDLTDVYFYGASKDPKFKTNKKTGDVTAKIAETWSNGGPGNLEAGAVAHFYSDTPLLYLSLNPPVLEQNLKPMAAPVAGKKTKKGKVKSKVILPANTGYVFTIAGPLADYLDPDWSNNVIRREIAL